jgi:hypothetical protein
MKIEWIEQAILRAACLLAPADRRAEWLREWRSELWYIPRHEAIRFCFGAFQDALWVRRNTPQRRLHLESPLSCLAFLATLAVIGLLIALCLPAPPTMTMSERLQLRDLPMACLAMALLSSLSLPALRLAMGPASTHRQPTGWAARLRRGIFLALKIALVHPVMLCGFLLADWIQPVAPVATILIGALWILLLRWVLIDQRRRCPVCLRLLSEPVRIGAPSQTFLDWYGAESMCTRGHGLLQEPEISTSYSGARQWLELDASWRDLFVRAGGGRR